MATILVLQHSKVGAGRLGATLRDHGFNLDIRKVAISVDQGGDPMPDSLTGYQGLLCLGGPASPDQNDDWILKEIELIKEAHAKDMPLIGICLGHQLIARALGGEVARMDKPEWGFEQVDLTNQGQIDSTLGGIPWSSPQFQSHAFEVSTPPPGATVLAISDKSGVQCFRAGQRTFGFQYHFESDGPMLEYFEATDQELMAEAGVNGSNFRAQAVEHYDMFARVADRLCINLVTFAFPFSTLTHA
jgi:GMP synthase-like glutamine amidotransferase